MSAPRFTVTFEIPGTSLKITMKTGITLSEDAESTVDELRQWVQTKTMAAVLANLKDRDLKAIREEWGRYYRALLDNDFRPPEDEPGKCPHCGGESDGSHLYSNPPQTRCVACGRLWSFGPGIVVLSEEEGRKKRPEMYERGPIDKPVKVETVEEFAAAFGERRSEAAREVAKHALALDPPHPTITRVNKHAWLKDHLLDRRKRAEPPEPIPDSEEWNRFVAQWEFGDELWSYSYDGGPLAQRAGLAIVRDGEPIAEFVEVQS